MSFKGANKFALVGTEFSVIKGQNSLRSNYQMYQSNEEMWNLVLSVTEGPHEVVQQQEQEFQQSPYKKQIIIMGDKIIQPICN